MSHSLAVDKHGCVLVADCYNHKVQILSSTLTHLSDITLPQHKQYRPYYLHLDELKCVFPQKKNVALDAGL